MLFRQDDRVVIVQLPFGEPKARAYIPLDSIMQTERAIAASNLVAMRAEEAFARDFYTKEANGCELENRAMLDDETRLKAKLAFDEKLEVERKDVAVKVRNAVSRARKFVLSLRGQREIAARTARALEREARTREIAARTWTGEGKRPRKMNRRDRAAYQVKRFRELRREFLLEIANVTESDARAAIESENAMVASENALEFIYFGFVAEFLSEMADDSLRSGLAAKSRAEDETGVVFGHPVHMQHAVYTILSRWWTSKKKQLKKQLEVWGAHSAQDELKREEERQKRQALVRDVEMKEKREKEQARQRAAAPGELETSPQLRQDRGPLRMSARHPAAGPRRALRGPFGYVHAAPRTCAARKFGTHAGAR